MMKWKWAMFGEGDRGDDEVEVGRYVGREIEEVMKAK